MLERVLRKVNPLTMLLGMYIDTATMENSVEVLKKTKNRNTIWPNSPTQEKTIVPRDMCTLMFMQHYLQ